jgi:hypothetical protein
MTSWSSWCRRRINGLYDWLMTEDLVLQSIVD